MWRKLQNQAVVIQFSRYIKPNERRIDEKVVTINTTTTKKHIHACTHTKRGVIKLYWAEVWNINSAQSSGVVFWLA